VIVVLQDMIVIRGTSSFVEHQREKMIFNIHKTDSSGPWFWIWLVEPSSNLWPHYISITASVCWRPTLLGGRILFFMKPGLMNPWFAVN